MCTLGIYVGYFDYVHWVYTLGIMSPNTHACPQHICTYTLGDMWWITFTYVEYAPVYMLGYTIYRLGHIRVTQHIWFLCRPIYICYPLYIHPIYILCDPTYMCPPKSADLGKPRYMLDHIPYTSVVSVGVFLNWVTYICVSQHSYIHWVCRLGACMYMLDDTCWVPYMLGNNICWVTVTQHI